MSSPAAVAARGPLSKLRKSLRIKPSEIESEIAKELWNLEANNKNLKTALHHLYINAVKEVEISDKKKALVVFFPLRFIRKFRKIQKVLTQELEKKFSGRPVILIAQRKMQRPPASNLAFRQRGRCLTAVHDAILEDMAYPADIVGRRWHYGTDGSKYLKVFFDAKEKERAGFESKFEIFETLYKKLASKEVKFGFMSNPSLQQIVA